MLCYQRMKRLYPVRPHVKKGNAEARHLHRVSQVSGTPGWLYLTHNEEGTPIALFSDHSERLTVVYIVFDERAFSDTVLRVVRLSPTLFVVQDIRTWNAVNVFETHSFEQRQKLLRSILREFHQTDLVALLLPEDVDDQYPIRGYECYDDQPGSVGVYFSC